MNDLLSFANSLSADMESSKPQLSKIVQLGRFLGRLFRPLVKNGVSLVGNVLKPLAKGALVPLELTAAASATEGAAQTNFLDQKQQHLYFQIKI